MNAICRPSGENVGQASFCTVFGTRAPPVPSALMIQIPPPVLVPALLPNTIRLPSGAHAGWKARIGLAGVLVVTCRLPEPSGLTT